MIILKALITGATSGIGLDMARYLATMKHELILVARDKEKLEKLTDSLSELSEYAKADIYLSLDWSKEDIPEFHYPLPPRPAHRRCLHGKGQNPAVPDRS